MYIVYILKCIDDTLYTGITTDLKRRLRQHNGELVGGAKYTRARKPVKVVYYDILKNRKEACKREYEIKQFTRIKKLKLINHFIKNNT